MYALVEAFVYGGQGFEEQGQSPHGNPRGKDNPGHICDYSS